MTRNMVTTETKALILVSRASGKSFRQIARETGLSDKTVAAALRDPDAAATVEAVRKNLAERFKEYGIDHAKVEDFKQDRPDILAGIQQRILASITEEDITKASLRDKTIAAGVVFDKERLERGQSTSNQSVFFRIVEESDRAEQ